MHHVLATIVRGADPIAAEALEHRELVLTRLCGSV